MIINSIEFQEFLAKYTKEELEQACNECVGNDDFRIKYNLSYNNLRELKKLYNLHYSEEHRSAHQKATLATKALDALGELKLQVPKDELIEFYITQNHNLVETAEHFSITRKKLLHLIKEYNCNKSKKQAAVNRKPRSHESYVQGGAKSADTQKRNWELKSTEEKDTWSQKMILAHNNDDFRQKISAINKAYRQNLSQADKDAQNRKRSKTCRDYWYNNFSAEERKEWIKTSLAHGAGWNWETIQRTNIEKYGVPNQYMRSDLNYNHTHSGPNEAFNKLVTENGLVVEQREFVINNRAYDFKIGDKLIEINPFPTHNSTWSPFGEPLDKKYHYEKSKLARDNGYQCICAWDWDDPLKIIELLKSREKVYARKCEIKGVPKTDAMNFINQWHLQGYAKDEIRIGLYYQDELISIMTFGKPRYNKNYEYELIRYCSSKQVLGGAEKLFTAFKNQYNPKALISYCDLSKFSGRTYLKLGFTFNKVTIGKHWYNPITGQHITDNLLRQRGFDQLFGADYGKGTSNTELMLNNGFIEIYDSGQASYIYKIGA